MEKLQKAMADLKAVMDEALASMPEGRTRDGLACENATFVAGFVKDEDLKSRLLAADAAVTEAYKAVARPVTAEEESHEEE